MDIDIENKTGLKISLSGGWLTACLAALMLPIFLPTFPDPQSLLQNAMGTATAAIYLLSFPLSLFGIPLLYISQILVGADPNSIAGKYLNLFLVFLLGLIQWFWIVPKLLRKEPRFEIHELPRQREKQLTEPRPSTDFDFFDSQSRSPLERVLRENDND